MINTNNYNDYSSDLDLGIQGTGYGEGGGLVAGVKIVINRILS